MMKRLFFNLLAVGVVFIASGCGAKDTPQQTVEDFRAAIVNSDQAAFLACFDASALQQQLLVATFDMEMALRAFRVQVAEAFGEPASHQFGADDPFITLMKMDPDELSFDVEGDRASLNNIRGFWEFTKVDGEWKITLGHMAASPEHVTKGVATMGLVGGVYREMIPQVTQEGMTVKQLQADLRAGMDALRAQHAYTEHQPPSTHDHAEDDGESVEPE